MTGDSPGLRIFTIVTTLLVVFVCGGIIYGFSPLRILLEEAGAFDVSKRDDSDYRSRNLNLVYALAAGALEFNGYFAGLALDKFGPAVTMIGLSLAMSISLYLMALFEWLGSFILYPACILCGLSGIGILLVGFSCSGLAPSRFSNYIILFTTCMFDSSTVIPLVLSLCYDGWVGPSSYRSVMLIYATFSSALMAVACIGWYLCEERGLFQLISSGANGMMADQHSAVLSHPSTPVVSISRSSFTFEDHGAFLEEFDVSEGRRALDDFYDGPEALRQGRAASSSSAVGMTTALIRRRSSIFRADPLPVARMSVRDQIMSPEFLLSLSFYLIHVLKANSYIGYLDNYLRDIDAAELQHPIGGLIALGFVWVFYVDSIIVSVGLGWTAQVMNAIGITYTAFLLTNSQWAQWPAVGIYGLYRAFVFGFPPILSLEVFGPATFGRISGLLFTMGGFPTLLCYLLTSWGESDGWNVVNWFLLLITFVAALPALWLQLKSTEKAFKHPKGQGAGK